MRIGNWKTIFSLDSKEDSPAMKRFMKGMNLVMSLMSALWSMFLFGVVLLWFHDRLMRSPRSPFSLWASIPLELIAKVAICGALFLLIAFLSFYSASSIKIHKASKNDGDEEERPEIRGD